MAKPAELKPAIKGSSKAAPATSWHSLIADTMLDDSELLRVTPHMLHIGGSVHLAHLHCSQCDGDAAPPAEKVAGGQAPEPSLDDAPSRQ